jgi:hypothetical protein
MNPEIAILALNILKWAQQLLAAGQDVGPILTQANTYLDAMVAEDRGPSDSEQAWIDNLRHGYEQTIRNAAAAAP